MRFSNIPTNPELKEYIKKASRKVSLMKPSERASMEALQKLILILGGRVSRIGKGSQKEVTSLAERLIKNTLQALRRGVDFVEFDHATTALVSLLTRKDKKVAIKCYEEAIAGIS